MTVGGRAGDDRRAEPRSALASFISAAAWTVGVIVLGLVALSALWRTADVIGVLLADFPGPYGRFGLLLTAAFLVAGAGVVALAGRAAARNWLPGLGLPLLIVALAIGVRVAMAVVADAPLRGENGIIHQQALGVLDGTCCFSHRPMGYPIALAGAYALLGIGPTAIEALNIAFAAVTAGVVWQIGSVAFGRPAAAMAASLYAVVPSQVLIAIAPLTEPTYTLLVAGAVRAAIALQRRPMVVAAVACAGLLAAGQYVRATAASLIAPIALLPWLVGWTLRRTVLRTALIGAVFGVLMLPVIEYNLRANADLSVSTSAYGGWSLYVGANRDHGGQWNSEDAARLASFPGDTWWARSEHAGALAVDRVLEDPAGTLAILPAKFGTVWGDETYAATYALRSGPVTRDVHVAWLTSQLAWVVLVVLAALGMLSTRRDPNPATLLIGITVSLVALTHLALEVHSRYHAYLVPLLCVLAAAGIEGLARWWRARRTT